MLDINWINRSAELAIVIGEKDFWGKDIGERVCRQIIKHGFSKLNLHRIWTGTAEYNKGMRRVAGKIGMTEEGLRRRILPIRGAWKDGYHYAIVEDDPRG